MVRCCGRASRGERLVCKIPFGAWRTLTFIAALRHDRVTAPLLLEGAMNGQIFRAYVEQVLAPTLRPGDVVIMDNVRMHKVSGVAKRISFLFARDTRSGHSLRWECIYVPPA